ncbi:MAG: hypothetical protein J5I90_03410 [Caldilineales bacterium]|nr:hypothetical protein [Caldilineales bacterium]
MSHRLPDRQVILPVVILAFGLLLLALGYWGRWLSHPVAALNILGVDLAEYVKFVVEVRSGQIPIVREVFFAPVLAFCAGLILLGTIRQPKLPWWLRTIVLALAVPAALSMLPPAWTPALLLRTPEFRDQVIYIGLILLAVALSPLLLRFVPDWLRGLGFALLAGFGYQALPAYRSLLPALSSLYAKAVSPGPGYYFTAVGLAFLLIGGVYLAISSWRARNRHP